MNVWDKIERYGLRGCGSAETASYKKVSEEMKLRRSKGQSMPRAWKNSGVWGYTVEKQFDGTPFVTPPAIAKGDTK